MSFFRRDNAHYVVLPAIGLAYGRVPKAANSMLKRQMARAAGIKDAFAETGFSKDRNWKDKAPDAYLVDAATLKRDWPDVLTFTIVREPLSRLASCYRSKISETKKLGVGMRLEGLRLGTTFPEFVEHVARRSDRRSNIHYRAQASILTHKGALVPDFVGRFETLAEDWDRLSALVRERTGETLPALPKRGRKRPIANPKDFFQGDERLIALARNRYAEDYRLFYPDQA